MTTGRTPVGDGVGDALPGLTLAMDASTGGGTLAIFRDGALLGGREVVMRSNDEERFFPAVVDLLAEAGVGVADLARVVCGAGPGSFTALRVVGAVAKGLCVARDIPLFAVPSLALIVAADDVAMREGGRWLATLDALRGERYLALVELVGGAAGVPASRGSLQSVQALGRAPVGALAARASELAARLIGPDEAHRALPHARGLAGCAALVAAAGPVDVAKWEPVYGRLAEAQVKWEAAHGRALG